MSFDKNYKIINGFKFPFQYSEESIKYSLSYRPKDGQKLIVSYPKSGTTWTQQIVYLILNNGIPEKNSKQFIFDTFLEFSGKNCITEPMIKTHLTYDLMPQNKSAKYLYVFRNPKDVCVSIYYHLKSRKVFKYEHNFHHFFNEFIRGEVWFGDYFEHILSFIPHLNDENLTFLVYEQMKRNPKEAVIKIGEFLGTEFVEKLKQNNEFILNEVLKYSTVDYMKSDSEKNPFIIRKGIIGDWRTHFNKEESDFIDEKIRQTLNGTQLQGLWDEDLKWE